MPVPVFDTNGISFDGDRNNRVIDIPTEATLQLFRGYSVTRPVFAENQLGLYSFVSPKPGEPRKVRFGRMTTPKHLLQKANGCGWNPKGRVSLAMESYTLGDVDYDGQQCPDELGECLNGLFGAGNDSKDILSTPAGRALWDELTRQIFLGIGNSMWDLAMFANHPIITTADANGWFNVSAPEWADYIGQQLHPEVGGLITILDQLKDVDALEQLQVPIASTDISADGKTFTGDVIALFRNMTDYALADFGVMIDEVRGEGAPIMLVTKSIFNAYKDYLIATYNAIPAAYQLMYQGDDGFTKPFRNVLLWDGIWIVQASSWATFDRINGVNTHRAVLTAPGNFGIGFDSQAVLQTQFGGVGMMIEQYLRPPYKGQIYMTTRFGLTGAIVDPDFLTMAAFIAEPA
jgi:hypothetical protein